MRQGGTGQAVCVPKGKVCRAEGAQPKPGVLRGCKEKAWLTSEPVWAECPGLMSRLAWNM